MDIDNSPEKTPESTEEPIRPTYAPIAMALAIAMTFWGLLTLTLNIHALGFMSIAGIGLLAWALKSWIREIVLHWESNR